MSAHATATGLSGGILVYAAGGGEPFTHRMVNTGKEIEVFTLDLSGEPAVVLQQVSKLAGHVTRRTSAAAGQAA